MEEHPKEEWAWKTWPLLALAARVHMILTYDDVQELTGMARVGVGPNCLGPIAAYCIINNIPALPCLVVGLDDGLPQYPGLLKHIPADRIPAEQQKCFKFN